MSDPTTIIELIVIVSVFGLVLSVWLVFILLATLRRGLGQEKVKKRLGLGQPEAAGTRVLRLWHDGEEATTTVPGTGKKWSVRQYCEFIKRSAGWKSPAETVLLSVVGLAFLSSAAVALFTASWIAAAGVFVSFVVVFWIYVQHRIARRSALFETQFIEAINMACRSLRAGHPLTGAFRLISDEIPDPVGRTFAEISQHQALGVSLEGALRQAASTSQSPDMKIFATSVIMQLRSGGNLAEMMERVAFVIRDRIRLKRRIRILTAQTQLSKRILIGLPIIIFALLNVMNPAYMRPLYSSTPGQVMLAIGLSGLLVGWWVMNKMARLQY